MKLSPWEQLGLGSASVPVCPQHSPCLTHVRPTPLGSSSPGVPLVPVILPPPLLAAYGEAALCSPGERVIMAHVVRGQLEKGKGRDGPWL